MKKIWIILIALVLIAELAPKFIVGMWGHEALSFYFKQSRANVEFDGDKIFVYIPTGSSMEDVANLLDENKIIKDKAAFIEIAEKKNYVGKNVVPGKYEIKNGWSNKDLINHLRAGNGRLEVKVTFNNCRTIEDIAGKVGKYIEADSAALISAFTHPDTMAKYGFNRQTFVAMFIPNTYQMDWATDAGEFIREIAKNYKKFWNADRAAKAKALRLSQSEVTTLASIVQAEQTRNASERPRIAGLYINRIRKGMRLQSDPTVVFAVGDFGIRRVLNKHLEYDSPYNTYRYAGLPPGPIHVPEISSIDAVLNYEQNDYIYMCAKPGYDGFHNFSKTVDQHEQYAGEYRRWLDSEGIKK